MKNETNEICFGKTSHTIERNKKIVKLLSEDKRPQQIAKELFITIWTVRDSIERMMERNGFNSVAGLVAAAIRKNLIC